MKDRPHHRIRDFFYAEPGRAVPWLNMAAGLGVGLLTRSLGLGLASMVVGRQVWDRMSPRMVIEDPRLGPVTLTCPRRSHQQNKQIWLTFDDGPGPDTARVLDILEAFSVPATFFFVGEKVQGYRELTRLGESLERGGHRVGNHSWSHPSFLGLDPESTAREIGSTQRLLDECFPESCLPVFRPPFGYRTENLFRCTRELRLSVMGWSLNSLDFLSGSAAKLVERVVERAEPGSILLFHDGPERRERTLSALPAILSSLQARGYEFAVPDLGAVTDE